MDRLTKYNTLQRASESMFKDKGSKHYGFALPVSSEEEINSFLDQLRKKHHAARHICYAWSLGIDDVSERWNDDGEPHNSAGLPIMRQIHSFDLRNVLICVVRYFGGTKLGIPGLINAYKTAAREAIENNSIVEVDRRIRLQLKFPYSHLSHVEQLTRKSGAKIINRNFDQMCEMILEVPESDAGIIFDHLQNIHTLHYELLT